MYDKPDSAQGRYDRMPRGFQQGIIDSDQRAINCIQCSDCEEKCPQGFLIGEWMPIIHEVLGERKEFVRTLHTVA
jgi:predicted aldo/keto reductase-like oxidoreductase